jgi:HEPN domain-containing protein/predicted nucleotidyltransferase
MLTTIDEITDRLVREYQPDRIILFGSRAEGTADDGSDYDILIIKDTDERPVDRRKAVENILYDRSVPLDLFVYSTEEIRALFLAGNVLLMNILENGRVLFMRKNTEVWIKDSLDELESAHLLLDSGKYKGACYHSQQSAEKALKALIIEKGEKPERIHDIVSLINKVKSIGWDIDFSIDDAILLNSIYKGRYPTEEGLLPYGIPDRNDAEQVFHAARRIFYLVQSKI